MYLNKHLYIYIYENERDKGEKKKIKNYQLENKNFFRQNIIKNKAHLTGLLY